MDKIATITQLSPLLSVRGLSEYLDVPERSILEWRRLGKGPRSFKAGREVRYRLEDVEAWIEAQSTEPAACKGEVR